MASKLAVVERCNGHRARFISYLAHETRGLVSSVQGGLHVARQGGSRYSLSHMLGLLDAMAIELHAMLSAALDSAQIEEGKLVPRLVRVDLRAVVKQVVDEFKLLAETRHLCHLSISMCACRCRLAPKRRCPTRSDCGRWSATWSPTA